MATIWTLRLLRSASSRNNLNVQIVAIHSTANGKQQTKIVPRAEDVIREGDLLVMLGEDRDLDRIRDIV